MPVIVMIGIIVLFMVICLSLASRASPPVIDTDMHRELPAAVISVPAGPMCVEPAGPWPNLRGVLLENTPTEYERRVIRHQIDSCSRGATTTADPWEVLALYRLEPELGVPEQYRGILAAAWCWESSMRSSTSSGDGGVSHGPFQMQQWFWDWCGTKATMDVLEAAQCFWARADYYLHDGLCPGNVLRAEAMAANGPRYKTWGCKAKSDHAREWLSWGR